MPTGVGSPASRIRPGVKLSGQPSGHAHTLSPLLSLPSPREMPLVTTRPGVSSSYMASRGEGDLRSGATACSTRGCTGLQSAVRRAQTVSLRLAVADCAEMMTSC